MKKFDELFFLKGIKGFGNVAVNKHYQLIASVDSLDQLVYELLKEGISKNLIEEAGSSFQEKIDGILSDDSIHIITIFDEEYPELLKDMGNNKPVLLFARGDISLLKKKAAAVIGTRKPSEWTKVVGPRLVKKMVNETDCVIVSGLALGCDTIAHQTTLTEHGKTVAVLPGGLNEIAPASNKGLAERILESGGCLLTEYEPDEKPDRFKYIERDSIVAALSDVTVILECAETSGTMHTAKAATKYNRRIACYIPEDTTKGDYSGNILLKSNDNTIMLSNPDEVELLISMLNKQECEIQAEQLSLFNLGLGD